MTERQFDTIIFDMDGVLIDSEPLWWIAEAAAFNAVGLPNTVEDGALTWGLRTDELVEYWYTRQPWQGQTKVEVEADITRRVIDLIRSHGEPMPGVRSLIGYLSERGYRLGLATSSSTEVIEAVLETIGISDRFEVTQSAEHEPFGKPHPGVYIEAARRLDSPPVRCLAIEDSPNGVLAAKSARMSCVAIPSPAMRGDRRYGIADYQVESLADLVGAPYLT